MPDEFEGWGTSTGLIDDVDVAIKDAQFIYHPDINNGETLLLKLSLLVDDADTKEVDQLYSCGKGWETNDQGKTAEREDGNEKFKFNEQTKYAKWFTAAIGCGAGPTLAQRGTARVAAVWIGLKFHVKSVTEEYTMDNQVRETRTLLPDVFHGVVGEGPAAKAEAATEEAPAEAAKAESNGAVGITGAMKAKLKKLATAAKTEDEFLEAAYGVEGVDGNAAVEDNLEAFYAEVKA